MGGFAFRDESGNTLASEIKVQQVFPTLDDFLENHLKPAGIVEYETIGSTGKKSLSGDIDIAVEIGNDDPKAFKRSLLASLQSTLVDGQVKFLGSNLAVLFPIVGDPEGKYVQIDVMPAKDLKNAAWLMSGTGSGVRGAHRNSLLAYLARKFSQSLGPREKVTIAIPGGLQKKVLPEPYDPDDPRSARRYEAVDERITDPQQILDILGVKASPGEVTRFEDLVDVLAKDPKTLVLLPGWEEYVLSSRWSKKGLEDAVEYIESAIEGNNLRESLLRKFVKFAMG
jgi:hypothetical protein